MCRTLLILSLALVPACSDPSSAHDVTLRTGSALLVAIDPFDDGDWQRVPPGADLTVAVGPRWIAVSVCDTGLSVSVQMQAYSAADLDVALPCWLPAGVPIAVPVTVTGADFASLDLGPYGFGSSTAGTVYAYPGTWDLFALSSDARVVVQRDVVVDAASRLVVDFAADGLPLEERPLDVTGAIGEVRAYALGELGAGTRWYTPFSTGSVLTLPTALSRDGDTASVFAFSDGQLGNSLDVEVALGDGPIAVAFPEPLDEVTLDADGASWDDGGAWDRAWVGASGGASPFVEWRFVDAEAAALGSIRFPDPTGVEGWDPAWDLDAERERYLSLYRDIGDGSVTATRTDRLD